jgi:L-fuconolactonase
LTRIAAQPNVVCKLSGIVAYTASPEPFVEELLPYGEHVIQVFGPNRVMWGSDWPVCTLGASFSGWVERALELTRGLSETERDAVFHGNARRIYRLDGTL